MTGRHITNTTMLLLNTFQLWFSVLFSLPAFSVSTFYSATLISHNNIRGKNMTHSKHQVASIELTLVEGKSSMCNVKHTFTSFAEANEQLGKWRNPGLTHADKCDFLVTWDDEERSIWRSTYFVDHALGKQSLNGHIAENARHQAGLSRPDSYSDEHWNYHQSLIEDTKEFYVTFLNTFEL
jgi:hypothetical protein